MSQIGVALSSRWDALTALFDLTKGYAQYEYNTISDTIKMRTSINGNSSAADVNAQENIFTQAQLRQVYPEIIPELENYDRNIIICHSYYHTMYSSYSRSVQQSRSRGFGGSSSLGGGGGFSGGGFGGGSR